MSVGEADGGRKTVLCHAAGAFCSSGAGAQRVSGTAEQQDMEQKFQLKCQNTENWNLVRQIVIQFFPKMQGYDIVRHLLSFNGGPDAACRIWN